MGKTIESGFGKTAQGWTMNDGSAVAWVAGGGNPGGSLAWSDTNDGTSYYAAPEKYLGNDHGFVGGALSYDIFDSANDYGGEADVELVGANGLTLVATVGQPGSTWTHYSIALDQTAGWHVGGLDGPVASKADIRSVLHDLSQLLIRAEYHAGLDESGGLDNVVLSKPVVGPPAAIGATGDFADHMAMAGALVHLEHAHVAIV